MLKKFLKAALTACLVAGMSTAAMAWAPIGTTGLMFGASTSASFGQYTSGIKDETSYLTGLQESHFSFYATKGQWSAWGDIEYDDHPQMHTSTTSAAKTSCSGTDSTGGAISCAVVVGKEVDAVNGYVNYAVSPQLSIRLGNIHHLAGLHYSNDGEMIGYKAGHAGWNYSGYTEAPGLGVYYTISPEMKLQVSLYTQYAAEMTGRGEGSATALDFDGKAGAIMYHVGYLTETKADHTVKGYSSGSNTFTNLGVKVPFGAMYVVFDYATAVLSYGSLTHEEKVADMGLQFGMKGIGPGELIVTYATQTTAEPSLKDYAVTCSMAALECQDTDTSILYSIAAGPGTMQFMYASSSFKPKDGDAVTKTWLATAFKVSM